MAKVIFFMFLTSRTIYAFCPGVTLENTTDLVFDMATWSYYKFYWKLIAEPSIIGLLVTISNFY